MVSQEKPGNVCVCLLLGGGIGGVEEGEGNGLRMVRGGRLRGGVSSVCVEMCYAVSDGAAECCCSLRVCRG